MHTVKAIRALLALLVICSLVTLLGCVHDAQTSPHERVLHTQPPAANRNSKHLTDDGGRQRRQRGSETWDTLFYGFISQKLDLLVEVYDTIFSFR